MPIRPLTNPRSNVAPVAQPQAQPAQIQQPAAPAQKFGAPAPARATMPPSGIATAATPAVEQPQQSGFFAPPVSTPAAPAPVAQQGVDIFDIPQDDFDPEAEGFETLAPAPPDDGDHLVRIDFSERVKEGEEIGSFTWKVNTKEGTVERGGVGMSLTAEIVGQNDPFQGRRVFHYATSLSKAALKADGTHSGGTTNDIALILAALNVRPTGAPRPDSYRLKELLPATLIITTQWEAQYPYDAKADEEAKAQGKKAKRKRPYKIGQQNFPVDEAGVPQPLYETPSGDALRTVATIIGFKRATS